EVPNSDILVSPGSATLNARQAGRNFAPPGNSPGSFLLSSGPVLASPGQSFTLALVGPGITPHSINPPAFTLAGAGSGVRVTGRGGRLFQNGTAFGYADITVADNAAPGTRQVRISVGGQTSYYTAGLVIAERDIPRSTQRLAAVQQDARQFTGIGVTN